MNQLLKNKKDIIAWLYDCGVEDYTLIPCKKYGYVVDVIGEGIYLNASNLSSIDVKFNHVVGDFICSDNKLTSLKGCPKRVVGDFFCDNNQLTSLMGCPRTVEGDFYCQNNQLISLEFCPQTVGGGVFYCANNPLLGDAQNIKNFDEIYALHLKTLHIINEKKMLNEAVGRGVNLESKTIFKL